MERWEGREIGGEMQDERVRARKTMVRWEDARGVRQRARARERAEEKHHDGKLGERSERASAEYEGEIIGKRVQGGQIDASA